MGVMLTMWVSFGVLGKFLVWFQGTRWCMVSQFCWNLNQRETMGPVSPNWFGSMFCLRTCESDRRPWDQPKPKTHCCTHSLHKGFKAFYRKKNKNKKATTSTFFKRQQASKQAGCTFVVSTFEWEYFHSFSLNIIELSVK